MLILYIKLISLITYSTLEKSNRERDLEWSDDTTLCMSCKKKH